MIETSLGIRQRVGLLLIGTLFGWILTPASLGADEPKFESLFNGKDLTGWAPQPGLWRVKDGVIEGGHSDGGPVERSSFMTVNKNGKDVVFRNFHFKAEFFIQESNSGVQYRSTRYNPKGFSVGGYQYEVSGGLATGFLYHQTHRGPHVRVGEFVINEPTKKDGLVVGIVADQRWLHRQKVRVPTEWGRCDIICRGNHIAHFVNGYPTIEYIDRDEKKPDRKHRNDEGVIALQIHSADAFRVQYRKLFVKQFNDQFGDAQRVFNDRNFEGWNVPTDAADNWSARPVQRDDRGRLKGFGSLSCKGNGEQPLILTIEHGPSFVFRCQVKCDSWKPSQHAPFRDVAGWSLLEVVVRDGAARLEFNGEPRADIPAPVHTGRIALPSNIAADYRNLTLIPIEAQ